MTDTDLERRLRALLCDTSEHRVDTGSGWRDFQSLRARATRSRRRQLLATAVAGAAAVLITVPILTGGTSGGQPGPGITKGPGTGQSSAPASPRVYQGAILARIPVGGVINLSQDGPRLWAVRGTTPSGGTGNTTYQLVGIDLRTDQVTLRVGLGTLPAVVAAGDGVVWRTTAGSSPAGQVVRVDPRTGKVITTLHLPSGPCGYLSFVAGQLWAECGSGRWDTVFLRLNPATGRVQGKVGPVRGPIGLQAAITPQGLWYDTSTGISGVVGAGRHAHIVTVRDNAYPVSFTYTQSLVYSQGALWALTNDESVAKINPVTGQVERVYSAVSLDPTGAGGLDFLTAGQGSLWFLDDGFPFSGVLRVNMATGKPLGGVTIKPGSCGEPCYQIYDSNGTIWVPTSSAVIGIDPARIPG